MVSVNVESYLKGVFTHKVKSIVAELGIELSHATVSNLSNELDEFDLFQKVGPITELVIDCTSSNILPS
nr:transposase [Nitrosophilus labii]